MNTTLAFDGPENETIPAEVIAIGWTIAFLRAAGPAKSHIVEPYQIILLGDACQRATESVRDAIHDPKWCPGDLEFNETMEALKSFMN